MCMCNIFWAKKVWLEWKESYVPARDGEISLEGQKVFIPCSKLSKKTFHLSHILKTVSSTISCTYLDHSYPAFSFSLHSPILHAVRNSRDRLPGFNFLWMKKPRWLKMVVVVFNSVQFNSIKCEQRGTSARGQIKDLLSELWRVTLHQKGLLLLPNACSSQQQWKLAWHSV